MSFAPQDNYSVHFPSQYHIAIRHPGQVRLRRTRAGIQMDSPSTSLDEIPLERLSDNPSNACICHSERSEESHGFRHTYTSEILRLTSQNDVVGQPLDPPLRKGEDFEVISFENSTHAQSCKKTIRNH